jgi:hypothetical protein
MKVVIPDIVRARRSLAIVRGAGARKVSGMTTVFWPLCQSRRSGWLGRLIRRTFILYSPSIAAPMRAIAC